ncbi:hypothetical protein F4808DRAFT_405300 [Astrocystis sublimbata]|nr:hypothetical protein F4808DRAFT_405300 [Astrocystis sublimbata]
MLRVGGGRGLFAPLFSASICLHLLSLLPHAHGRSMCSILDQRTAIVDDKLYFSSGNYSFDDDGLPRYTSPYIYWLPLNETVDVSGAIDTTLLGSVSLPHRHLWGGKIGPFPDPGGYSGVFLYDHTTLYPFTALSGEDIYEQDNSIWSFNTSNNEWKLETVAGGKQLDQSANSEGISASDPRTGTSFFTGGYILAREGYPNATVKFQTANDGDPQWSFETGNGGMPGPDILKGDMVYVRKGQAGILIAFGGYNTAYPGVTDETDRGYDLHPFSDIWIFDIYSSTWFHQTATGDLPEHRAEFCAAVSSAPDDSSFQITMTGGWDPINFKSYNDVYVLSLPAFRWMKVKDSNNPDLKGSDKPGRNRHKCTMWNETSMLVVGGEVTLGQGQDKTSLLTVTCNDTYPPIRVLDTSTYIWKEKFDPESVYSVPKVVTDAIGGDSSGSARMTQPEHTWESDELAEVFSHTVERDSYIPPSRLGGAEASRGGDSTSPENSSDAGVGPNDQDSVGLEPGAIAGIVVGVIVGIAAIVGLVWALRSRRQTSTPNRAELGADGAASSIMGVPLVERWGGKVEQRKTGLDPIATDRYELGVQKSSPQPKPDYAATPPSYELSGQSYVYEVHGDDVKSFTHTPQ